MTRMHLMWFCAFSPHAGFGLDGWAGPRTSGYEWTRPELWQDMAVFKARVKKQGRDPDECKVFFLTKPIIGDTDEAAQRRADGPYPHAPGGGGAARPSAQLPNGMSTHDPPAPLP